MQNFRLWFAMSACVWGVASVCAQTNIQAGLLDRVRQPLDAAQLRGIRHVGQAVSIAHDSQRTGGEETREINALRAAVGEALLDDVAGSAIITGQRAEQQDAGPSRAGGNERMHLGPPTDLARPRLGGRRKASESIGRLLTQADAIASKADIGGEVRPMAALANKRAALLRRWAKQVQEAPDQDGAARSKELLQLRELLELSPIAPSEEGYVNRTPSAVVLRNVLSDKQ